MFPFLSFLTTRHTWGKAGPSKMSPDPAARFPQPSPLVVVTQQSQSWGLSPKTLRSSGERSSRTGPPKQSTSFVDPNLSSNEGREILDCQNHSAKLFFHSFLFHISCTGAGDLIQCNKLKDYQECVRMPLIGWNQNLLTPYHCPHWMESELLNSVSLPLIRWNQNFFAAKRLTATEQMHLSVEPYSMAVWA